MALPLQYNKRTFASKIETTYGTGVTVAAEDCERVNDVKMEYASPGDAIERPKSDGGLGYDISVPQRRWVKLDYDNFLHGNGTDGEPSFAAKWFPCVGMPSPSSNTYTTSSTTSDWKGMSAAVNRSGRRNFGRGFMGNLKIDLEAGQPLRAFWSMIGGVGAGSALNKLTDTSQLTGLSLQTVTPPKFISASALTVQSSTALKIAKASIDLQTQPFARQDAVMEGGHIGGFLTDIKPMITFPDAEALPVATLDWITRYEACTLGSIVFVAGSVTGNIITMTATNCQLINTPTEGNRNGMLTDALKFRVTGSFTIAFS